MYIKNFGGKNIGELNSIRQKTFANISGYARDQSLLRIANNLNLRWTIVYLKQVTYRRRGMFRGGKVSRISRIVCAARNFYAGT